MLFWVGKHTRTSWYKKYRTRSIVQKLGIVLWRRNKNVLSLVQIISHEGNSNFSCSRWSDHKLHPTLEKSLHNQSKKNIYLSYLSILFTTSVQRRGELLACSRTTQTHKIKVWKCFSFLSLSHLDFRISIGFSNLPEIRVQRWKHRVLAGMRRLQVGLGGGASLPSWADLSEVHPARSLQRGQLVTLVGGVDEELLRTNLHLHCFALTQLWAPTIPLVSPVAMKYSTIEEKLKILINMCVHIQSWS